MDGRVAAGRPGFLFSGVGQGDAEADRNSCDEEPTLAPSPTALSILDYPSLYQTFSGDFLIGAAIEPDQLDSPDHVTLLTHHFNSLAAENAMKPESIEPAEGDFHWEGADRLVEFAKSNHIAVHGHTLVWHQQAAEWMFRDESGRELMATPANKALVLRRLEDYIRAVVGRYKDEVGVWDVVNEVIDPSKPDCMLRSDWYTLTGTDYIETAFRTAHEVAPNAVLLMNDYCTTDPPRRDCFYKVVKDLKAKGVPVDGVGHQMHLNIDNPTAAAIEEAIVKFSDLGLEQIVTELDMSIYPNDTDKYTVVPEEILVRQGHRYKEVFDVFRRHAADIQSVTFWGMADDHTWLKTWPTARINLPLLFDENLQPKPAYWGIIDPSRLPVLTRHLDASEGTPVVDGEAEDLWNMQSWPEIRTEETLVAGFQTLWDADNLYVYADVKDATHDPADTIEIFVDQNNGKTDSYEADDVHVTCRNGACNPSDSGTFVLRETEAGYQLE
jgi:endo-1,4-beta-xylanase